ncbi:hypothetical protein [Crocosphaera sp. Alani8]|uniref:hypothetical protein n=1 Tax=Crocosphaera sp. Alani8 TaxID=3038952 RepID=UPI00313B758B
MKTNTLTPTPINEPQEKQEDSLFELTFKAQVMGEEGHIGQLRRIIVKPKTMVVSYIVVELSGLFGFEKYLVPIDYISSTTPQFININCTQKDLMGMKPYCETYSIKNEYWEQEMVYGPWNNINYASDVLMSWSYPFPEQVMPYMIVEKENLLPGELAISDDIRVEALDGLLGKFDGLLVSKNTQMLKGLLVRSGNFLNQKERLYPAKVINKIEDNKFYLKSGKKVLKSFLSISRKRFFNQTYHNYNAQIFSSL